MGKRYVSNVLMTTAVLLRSGMKRNFHVPFWRAVEGATLSLTLIIASFQAAVNQPESLVMFCSLQDVARAKARSKSSI